MSLQRVLDLTADEDPEVVKAVRIPQPIEKLLISSTITIRELLNVTDLPRLDTTSDPELDVEDCFSDEFPVVDYGELRNRPIPCMLALGVLNEALRDAVHRGQHSFTDSRFADALTPLWIIPYWSAQRSVVKAHRNWTQAKAWLDRLVTLGDRSESRLAQMALRTMDVLQWNVPIRGAGSGMHIHELPTLLSDQWISSSVIDSMMSVIQRRISLDAAVEGTVEVQDLSIYEALRRTHHNWDEYDTARSFKALRELGARLRNPDKLKLLFLPWNTDPDDGDHWVVYLLDVVRREIQYGDPFGDIPLTPDITAIQRWLGKSGAGLYDLGDDLPHGDQDDSFSCSINMGNIIKHKTFGDPLWTPARKRTSRIQEYLHLVNSHLHAVKEATHKVPSQATGISPTPTPTPSASESTVHWSFNANPLKFEADSDNADVSPPQPDHGASLENTMSCMSKGVKQSADPKQTELTMFFGRCSRETLREQMIAESERRKERAAELRELKKKQAISALAQRRENDRIRQEKCRARKKAREIRSGKRDTNGKLKKKITIVKELTTEAQTEKLLGRTRSVAEISRPRRGFKEEIHAQIEEDAHHPGRKRKQKPQQSRATNWFQPFLWSQIVSAGLAAGHQMQPTVIEHILKKRNPVDFAGITSQVIGRMIERPRFGKPRWSDQALARALSGETAKAPSTRIGILSSRPDLVSAITNELRALRATGVPVSLATARAITVAHIEDLAPEILRTPSANGQLFKCSESFMRKFLHQQMGWSLRKATRAAQKTPVDALEQCRTSFARQARKIRDNGIPAACRANIDQSNIQLLLSMNQTYDITGANQVSVLGAEEKRAFTLLVGVSASGELLPFQVIWQSKTQRSLPSKHARKRQEADELGFLIESSMTKTYWSTFPLMCSYVNKILVPYFNRQKERLRLPADQACILQLDVWSVHRGEEFASWLEKTHPWIEREYVPGGCTGLFQPCDLGIQRPLKHAIRQAQHADVVAEALSQIQRNNERRGSGKEPIPMKLDTTLGTLRDRSIGWLVDAYKAVNKPEIVLKAFELCCVGDTGFNLSQESLTSPAALHLLRDIELYEPEVWRRINGRKDEPNLPTGVEEPPFDDSEGADDTSVPLSAVLEHVQTGPAGNKMAPVGYIIGDDGTLSASMVIEELDHESLVFVQDPPPVSDVRADLNVRGHTSNLTDDLSAYDLSILDDLETMDCGVSWPAAESSWESSDRKGKRRKLD